MISEEDLDEELYRIEREHEELFDDSDDWDSPENTEVELGGYTGPRPWEVRPLTGYQELMARVLLRPIRPEEKDRLDEIKSTLKLADDDALWVLIVAMQYHLSLYQEIPEKIKQSRGTLLAEEEKTICQRSLEQLEGQKRELSGSANRLAVQIMKNLDVSAKKHLGQINRQGMEILQELKDLAVAVPQPRYSPWAYVCLTISFLNFLALLLIILTVLFRPHLLDKLNNLL